MLCLKTVCNRYSKNTAFLINLVTQTAYLLIYIIYMNNALYPPPPPCPTRKKQIKQVKIQYLNPNLVIV